MSKKNAYKPAPETARNDTRTSAPGNSRKSASEASAKKSTPGNSRKSAPGAAPNDARTSAPGNSRKSASEASAKKSTPGASAKKSALKAVVSSLLLISFLFLAASGAALFFFKTGVILWFPRGSLRGAHALAALLTCALVIFHFLSNSRVFINEIKKLTGRR